MSTETGPHIVSPMVYLLIWLALMVGTGLTVFAALQDFGIFNAIIALVIATTKAILVSSSSCTSSSPGKHIALVILSGIFFLAVLPTLTLQRLPQPHLGRSRIVANLTGSTISTRAGHKSLLCCSIMKFSIVHSAES